MKKYNGTNPFVKKLIKKFGGKVCKLKDLPVNAQLALDHYMAIDGAAWEENNQAERLKAHAEESYGLVNVPLEELKKAVSDNFKADPDKQVMTWKDFDEYHQWYMEDSVVDDHGKSVWPVILNCYKEELFQDGWHRFHSYADKGIKTVPCLYYVS